MSLDTVDPAAAGTAVRTVYAWLYLVGAVVLPLTLVAFSNVRLVIALYRSSRCAPRHVSTTARQLYKNISMLLGPFHGAIAVPSVTRCRCCRCCRCCCGHRCAGGVRQRRRATVATPGEWQCKTGGVRRLAVANGPNIFQMLLVIPLYACAYAICLIKVLTYLLTYDVIDDLYRLSIVWSQSMR